MNFSERLTSLRKQKGWSQEELGDKLGVTRQTVSKWELGLTTPEMEKLSAMSELFGISIDELIKGEQPALNAEKSTAVGFSRCTGRTEYKSKKTWHGLPLVHINMKGKAKGVIAIGLMAKGIVSIGLLSMGVVSVGLAALGIIALGGFLALGVGACGAMCGGVFAAGGLAAGVFAAGGLAAGWVAVGGLAAGQYACGGFAVGEIAVGGYSEGVIAVGDETRGEITFNIPASAEQVKQAILSRLPNTPRFITEGFSSLAQMLHTE